MLLIVLSLAFLMININCDLGEGLNNEHVIMPLINSCNIACGGHAGDSQTMIELKKQLENQEHNCYICNDSITLKKEDVIRTPCNHIYHFECLYYSFYKNSMNHHKKYN